MPKYASGMDSKSSEEMQVFLTRLESESNVLHPKDLSVTVSSMDSVAERVRLRLREEMTRRTLSQRDVSDLLGGAERGWSQSRVAKILAGRVEFGIDEAAALAFALDLSLVEVVRDPGLEFCAEMQPSELRLLDKIRKLPPATWEALMTILQLHPRGPMARYAKKPKELFPPVRARQKARNSAE